MRRASSSRSARIKAQASPYHTSVTLFKIEDDAGPGSSTPRRPKRVKMEDDALIPIPDVEDVIKPTSNGTMKPTKSPRKPKPVQQALKTPHPSPPNWKETYDTIKEMRSKFIAPVDTMGCDQAQLKEKNPKVRKQIHRTTCCLTFEQQNQRFATLISLMLSSQTKDEVTDAAVAKLRAVLGGSISVESVLVADESTIADAIGKVGFWRRKTQ